MLKQNLQQKLGLKINPLQIQLIKLLELPTYQLEQRIKEELESNPLLEEGEERPDPEVDFKDGSDEPEMNEMENEEDDRVREEDEFSLEDYMGDDDDTPDYKLSTSNASRDDDEREFVLSGGESFRENLLRQLGVKSLPEMDRKVAEYIIGSARAALIRNLPSGVKSEVRTVVVEETKEKKKPNVNELGVEQLKDVGNIIGVASGKGGVGKSTVAVNLACALARLGYKVGLADADVYGPSVPTMTATEGLSPMAEETADGKELILPVEKYGVKWMSIGYFAEKGQALIWRGPMACNALKQMILQVKWGELDFLLVDMPPGTGDIHISLLQDIPVDGAIVVTTPQKVALADVEKGVNMFRNPGVGKPIFGLVENMAWFTPEEHPDERYYIFGKDGGAEMASALGIDLLGRIPLVQGLRESGDAGEPAALSSRPDGVAFLELAGRLAGKLGLK